MGMSTHIHAFISDNDEAYKTHKKVLLVCLEAGVDLPTQTAEFFGAKQPYLSLLDDVLEVELQLNKHYTEFEGDMREGFEVDLTKLPKNVSILRFVNSY